MSFSAQACFNETLCIAMCILFPCHIIFTSSLPEIVSSFSILEKQIDTRKPIGWRTEIVMKVITELVIVNYPCHCW